LVARISNILKSQFFNFFSRLKDFDGYVIKLKRSLVEARPENQSIAWSLTADISKQLEIKRGKLKSKQSVAEIVMTIVFCTLIGLANLNIVDTIIIAGGIAIIVFAHWESFKVYISEFIPYYIAEQTLLGKDVTFKKVNEGLG
jgi:hypothetical protein